MKEQYEKSIPNISYLTKRNATIDVDNISIESDQSFGSFNDIKAEYSLGDLSDLETVVENQYEEAKSEMGDLDDELIENRRIEAQRALAVENLKIKKPAEPEPILPSVTIPKPVKSTKSASNTKVKVKFGKL